MSRSIRARVAEPSRHQGPEWRERVVAFGVGHMTDIRITPDEAWKLADLLTAACVEAGAFKVGSDITKGE